MNTLDLFRHSSDTVSFEAGTTLFRPGDPGSEMYVVLEGIVEILVDHVCVEEAGPGTIVGELALIDDSPRSATARAQTGCKLARVDRKRFQFLISQTPFFSLHVMKTMADRLRRTDAKWVVKAERG